MAARSIASLTITFGLVSIPVKLYSATQARAGISFHLIHKSCGSRLRQQYFCIKEDVPVERADMVKGYEFAKDQYVTFSAEELKELEEKGTGTVEIAQFVPEEKIDPIYYDKAYYLAPDKGGPKPYALLSQAMKKTGRCALARWAARGKQYIVQLRPVDGALVMQQLLYADEVRPMSEIEIPPAQAKEPELKLAEQLIEQISVEDFDPSQYEDEVKKRIEAAVERKVEGEEVSVSPEPEKGGAQIIDLMAALRESLNKAPKKPAPARAAPTTGGSATPAERKPAKRATAAPAKAGHKKLLGRTSKDSQ
ncbi:MAG: Ku protein [Gammaproteobacteria bacterium]